MAALIKAGALWYRRVKSSRRLYAWSRERDTATAFDRDMTAISVGARLSVDAGLVEIVDAADGHLIATCEDGRMQR